MYTSCLYFSFLYLNRKPFLSVQTWTAAKRANKKNDNSQNVQCTDNSATIYQCVTSHNMMEKRLKKTHADNSDNESTKKASSRILTKAINDIGTDIIG